MAKLFEGARKNIRSVIIFCILSALFAVLESAYQFFFFSAGDFNASLVRGFAFAGTTFIAASLFSSVIFRFKPVLFKHWPVRRNFGVVGVFFIIIHILLAVWINLGLDLSYLFFSLNPFENPMIFGLVSIIPFTVIALISTDWAMQKLGTKWKKIQMLVHPALLFAVFHFLKQNPAALDGPPWWLLAGLVILTLAGDLYWFARVTVQNRKITRYTLGGLVLIILYIVFAFYAFVA